MARRANAPDGGIIVWKPRGPSSRALLDQVQQRLQWRGLGHCGTLDPLASGVMVLIGGAARRFQQLLTGHDKRYLATVWLGVASASDDAEGPLSCPVPAPRWPTTDQIVAQLEQMTGLIEQVPPVHSAVRIAGRRSYQRARAGDTTAPPSRTVMVHSIELIEHDQQRLQLEISCGSGTYIRSIARDLGQKLGCQASLMALRRSASGSHEASMAVLPDRVVASDWLSLEQLLAAQPRIEVSREHALRLSQGQRVPVDEVTGCDLLAVEGRDKGPLVVWSEDRVRGLVRIGEGVLRPRRWLASSDNDTSDQRRIDATSA